MNAFETNDFFKNHSHLDSKRQKSGTRTTPIFLILLSGNFTLVTWRVSLCWVVEPLGRGVSWCPLVTPKSYFPVGALVNFFGHLSGIYSKAMVVFRYNLVYWHLIFCKYITSVV